MITKTCLFTLGWTLFYAAGLAGQPVLENPLISVQLSPKAGPLWTYTVKGSGEVLQIAPPRFELDGREVAGAVEAFTEAAPPRELRNGVTEYTYAGALRALPDVTLTAVFQLSPDNPSVRFHYALSSSAKRALTKQAGKDHLTYFATLQGAFVAVTEVQFSNYDQRSHSYHLAERALDERYFQNERSVMGPLLVLSRPGTSFLLAYEHGSDYGQDYLHFDLSERGDVALAATKGNYLPDQPIGPDASFETLWFEVAGTPGSDRDLAAAYRTFVLRYLSENAESRKPYIFYNTWGRQERVKWGGGTYNQSMNLAFTLAEIERAHRMGVEVYVVDTGWYVATGDWRVNTDPAFFPDGLKQVKALLDQYGMKLGLWFNPRMAALSSEMLARNQAYRTAIDGEPGRTEHIWETEESAPMCLVSPYWKDFADRLSQLVEEVGVSYFKWDALYQTDCNAPGHDHGTADHSAAERYDRDGFLMPVYLSRIIDRVTEKHPEAIFDFDITEPGRAVGLSFLASGKYFAINNGPYYHNLDVSPQWETPLANGNVNVLVNPGPTRPYYLRTILSYDKWIPSTLFLTHYQPDEPRSSQLINIASLILGQNGIWGEILKTSDEGTALFGELLGKYKDVRDDITRASPTGFGRPGESVEVHEKINPASGRGAVVVFGNGQRVVEYVTEAAVDRTYYATDGVTVRFDDAGRALVRAEFTGTGAQLAFFGTR